MSAGLLGLAHFTDQGVDVLADALRLGLRVGNQGISFSARRTLRFRVPRNGLATKAEPVELKRQATPCIPAFLGCCNQAQGKACKAADDGAPHADANRTAY